MCVYICTRKEIDERRSDHTSQRKISGRVNCKRTKIVPAWIAVPDHRTAGVGFMAALKLFLFAALVSLAFAGIRVGADSSIPDVDGGLRSDGLLEELKSKVHKLEHHIEERSQQIKDRDMVIATKEKIIKEKLDTIVSLEGDITSLQEKGRVDATELAKAHARGIELETQVKELTKDLHVQTEEKEKLKSHSTEADKKVSELTSKVESLQKTVDDQKNKLQKTERALQLAEEEVMKTKVEFASNDKVLLRLQNIIDDQKSRLHKIEQALQLAEEEAEKAKFEASSKDKELVEIQRIIEDQKTKLQKTEQALQLAEEEAMKAKFEVSSKDKELLDHHSAWLPPWLLVRFIHYQSLLKKNWEVHGRPAVELFIEKAIQKKAVVEEWAAPSLEILRTKWVPVVKGRWAVISTNLQSHVQTIGTKTIEIYATSKDAATPHIIKVVEVVNPYFQELREVSMPYVDQVATATRPHVDALRAALKPYAEPAVHTYGRFLESATMYHHHVQGRVEEKLKSHELTEPLATKELVWFTASALLALPLLVLLKIFSASFCKKSQRPALNITSKHSRRKAKHGHAKK